MDEIPNIFGIIDKGQLYNFVKTASIVSANLNVVLGTLLGISERRSASTIHSNNFFLPGGDNKGYINLSLAYMGLSKTTLKILCLPVNESAVGRLVMTLFTFGCTSFPVC